MSNARTRTAHEFCCNECAALFFCSRASSNLFLFEAHRVKQDLLKLEFHVEKLRLPVTITIKRSTCTNKERKREEHCRKVIKEVNNKIISVLRAFFFSYLYCPEVIIDLI